VFIDSKKNVPILRRNEKDIWQGLYQFPLLESESRLTAGEVIQAAKNQFKIKGLKKALLLVSGEYKHLLSHQTIYAVFYVFYPINLNLKNGKISTLKKLRNHAFPKLLLKFLKDCELTEIV
jgi:A/G-specific adenine glycosylase